MFKDSYLIIRFVVLPKAPALKNRCPLGGVNIFIVMVVESLSFL